MVFVAVGFETTTPATAVAVKQAAKEGIDNFCILSNHKIVVPAMQALLSDKNNKIDAFLCPGHVSVITGYGAFKGIVEQFCKALRRGGLRADADNRGPCRNLPTDNRGQT